MKGIWPPLSVSQCKNAHLAQDKTNLGVRDGGVVVGGMLLLNMSLKDVCLLHKICLIQAL